MIPSATGLTARRASQACETSVIEKRSDASDGRFNQIEPAADE
jgi:hypothetical protein